MLEQSDIFIASLVAAASNALACNLDAARTATELVRASDPNFRIQNINYRLPHRQHDVLTQWEDALRRAGMAEQSKNYRDARRAPDKLLVLRSSR